MRRRIRQIASGKFEYDQPSLSISEEELLLTVTEEQEYTGEFEITSENNIPVRGVVYSTHPRMECLTPQFEGEHVRIRYQFHSRGLIEGQEEKGAFIMVCNQSVHSLSFCVSISRLYAQTHNGSVRSLTDFVALARENWQEAYQLFYHKSFSNIFKAKEIKERMLYEGFLAARPSQQNLEEFLVGSGRKGQIHFTVSKKEERLSAVSETQQLSFDVQKSEWGYLELDVSVDADFVRLLENHVTSENFLGSIWQCRYFIDYDRMHAGHNRARITISSVYETRTVEIYAHKDAVKEPTEEQKNRLKIKTCQAKLVKLYEDYRLKKIVTGVWSTQSAELLDQLHALLPDEAMYLLMKAQTLVINRQKQEAEWILDAFKREWANHHSVEWAYYLYVMSLLEREPSYVDRITGKIQKIFRQNPESPLCFWMLLFLEEEYYNNDAHKLRAIAHWVMNGCTSPYLYVEAYYVICQNPYLLTRPGRFEIRILRWAIRRNVLTKELAAQIFEMVEINRGFDPVMYELMCAAYETDDKPEYLGIICSYLIRAQKFEVRFHGWFEKGIDQKLRITGLYEAYLLSLDEREIATVPKIIQMYFQYESNLPYQKMAILYSNIIAAKEREPEIYEQYRKVISRFAMEQIEQGHMDDNLAVIYEDILELGLVNAELARGLSKVLFTHKLVILQKDMAYAIVYQRPMKEPQVVPVTDGCAYVSLFCEPYVILFEDTRGRRYAASVPYREETLILAEPYLKKCRDLAPEELPYLLPYFGEKPDHQTFVPEDEKFFPRLLAATELNSTYQAVLAGEIIHYYQTKDTDEKIIAYLKRADFSLMPQAVRQYMMETLVELRMYEQAYELMQIYGMDQVGAAPKVTLASHMLAQQEEFEEDEFLLALCAQAFASRKYNDAILRYLCEFYIGPVQDMLRIWRAAENFELQARALEERILEQMLYADMDLMPVTDLFLHYEEAGGAELIVLAGLTVYARAYFVQKAKIRPEIFSLIRRRFYQKQPLNDACNLALLQSLAGQPLSDTQFVMEDQLLEEYTSRNMNFAFYKKMDKRLVNKYHLYDKVYVEYRTDPRKHVVLHYSRDEDGGNFHSMELSNVYDGIFTEAFVMFFGEEVQYYITEEYKNQVISTESNRLTCSDIYAQKDESRYNLLNQMLISGTLSEDTAMVQTMERYAQLDEVTKKAFKLL